MRCASSLLWCALLSFVVPATGRPATPDNATSALGVNLTSVYYSTSEQPFLNSFKTNSGWSTNPAHSDRNTDEEKYLDLDSDGWPRSLTAVGEPQPQKFAQVSALWLRGSRQQADYRSGRYIVRYRGEGTIEYGYDAKKLDALSRHGRDVLEVNAAEGGIILRITSTDPKHTGDYIRDIQVVRAELEQALLDGQLFNPDFLERLRHFRVLRFMDWFRTNGTKLSSWSARSLPSNMKWWDDDTGVPYEVGIQLANTVSADPWINIPARADDNFIAQLASLVHAQLGRTQKVYVEYSNETWNTGFPQTAWITQQGKARFPQLPEYLQNRVYFGMRTAQICDSWTAVWGRDADRVVCVLAAQSVDPATAANALECVGWKEAPCVAHHISAVAIAPYFTNTVPKTWTQNPDGGLSALFTSLTSRNDASIPEGGSMSEVLRWVAAYHQLAAKYRLSLVAYEGGQSFVAFPNGANPDGTESALTRLYIAANRDPRMADAYARYLQGWKSAGGELFVHYNDIGRPTQWGEWGLLESLLQPVTPLAAAPPKWRAVQEFISANPCWWSHCSRDSVPSAAVTGASVSGRP